MIAPRFALSPARITATREGALEHRALQYDLVVLARVLDVDRDIVQIDSVESPLKGPAMYREFEYTLLFKVYLQVLEYLKGEGPDSITAMVESQYVFDSEEEGPCARMAFAANHGQLIDSDRGIAFLEATDDPDFYHMGYAYEDFVERPGQLHSVGHSRWLPGQRGSEDEDWNFHDRKPEKLVGLAEVKERVSSVIEEYARSDDEKWQSCVGNKYFNMGRDPWDYRGVGRSWKDYRDHDIIFNGEHVPVPAGTMVWNYPEHHSYRGKLHMSLEGQDADLFEVVYHSEYERIVNEWGTASGGSGFRLAVWYIPVNGRHERWRQTVSGHVITAVEDLAEGEYTFNLSIEDRSEDFVDCGQDGREPSKFRVIVDADRPTTPPAPASVQVTQRDEEGWTIGWDPVDGVDLYWFKVYRISGGEEKIDAALDSLTGDSKRRIRFQDMRGCGDVVHIEIWPKGDGSAYVKDYGGNSAPIELRTAPCTP